MKIKIDEAIQQFLIDQELKGNTPKTVIYYSHNLRYFREYIKEKETIDEIGMLDLNGYLLMLKKKQKLENHPFKPKVEKPISTTTIQTYVRAVRSFLGWLYKEGYITENLQEKYKLPKAIKKTVEILSDEEIDTLMNSFNTKSELGLRNACLAALMLDCGLRRNEALYLDFDNVHITQGIIKVIGKGQKERIVPIGLYTRKLLLKYINGYRPMPDYDTKRLLIGKDLKPMTENSVKQLFFRLRKKCNIDRLHPHMLRHTFATKYLMNGGDIFTLQQILGHTSLEMVRKYSHIASAYMIKSHKKFSPLDNVYKNKYNA